MFCVGFMLVGSGLALDGSSKFASIGIIGVFTIHPLVMTRSYNCIPAGTL